MPGITGQISFSNKSYFEQILNSLYNSNFTQTVEVYDTNISIANTSLLESDIPIFSNDELIIVFHGYLRDWKIPKIEINSYIKNLFNEYGEKFITRLRGSFQILIYLKNTKTLLLFTDQTNSRPIFYVFKNNKLFFSPETSPLQNLIDKSKINNEGIVHFIISGCFPSRETFFSEIKMMRPGEMLKFQNNKIKNDQYYKYEITPQNDISKSEFLELLDQNISNSIYSYWKQANNPAILLSGGYDSQFIFYSIADIIEDTSKITTVTWGDNLQIPNSDVEAANNIANIFNTNHIIMKKDPTNFKSDFAEMFKAHSGMTDSCLDHASELQVSKKLREQGIKSLFRGDECFGFNKYAYSKQEAISFIGKSFSYAIPELKEIYSNSNTLEKYDEKIDSIINNYRFSNFNDLKDTLYFNERLAMYLQPLNYFKMHYQEIYNPLIDIDILNISRRVPSKYRIDKELFKELFNKKFSIKYNPKHATLHNMTIWQDEINTNEDLKIFLIDSINSLPSVFNKEYLASKLNTNKSLNIKAKLLKLLKSFIKKGLLIDIIFKGRIKRHPFPNDRLMIRIATLAEWFKNV